MLLNLLLMACSTAPPARPSLVVVTLDTTRADRLGAYGHAAAHTPTLDALAQEGLRFERAYATVPLTTPSHASMFTGLLPGRHGVHTNGDAVLSEGLDTLAERLRAEGWATGASVAAFVTTRIWNLDQGFDAYHDAVPPEGGGRSRWSRERPADEVVDDALAWLGTLPPEQPFFLWVHVYDPHHPYEPPPEALALTPGRPYDGELAFVDAQLARLRPAVEAAAGPGGAAWILIADHGEALTEDRGEHAHGLFLFDETTRVPFILRPATPLDAPVVIASPTVSGVDLMPTALGMLGLAPPSGLDGVDLSPLLRGEPLTRAPVALESYTAAQRFGFAPERAVVEGTWKLMATPNPRLFDLARDPGETENLVAREPAQARRLRAALDGLLAQAVEGPATAPSSEVIEQLAALGYLGAGGAVDLDSAVDAKDQVEVLRALERARALSARDPEGAEALWRALLEAQPGLQEARLGLAMLLERSGRLAEAEATLRSAGADGSAALQLNLARVLGLQGRAGEAAAELEALLARVPEDARARAALLGALASDGRAEEAVQRARAWLAVGESDPSLEASLGVILARTGRLAEAAPHLAAGAADGVDRPGLLESEARLALTRGDAARATLLLETELSLFPVNPPARRLLAGLYMGAGRWPDAEAQYRRLAEAHPGDVDAARGLAQALFNQGDFEAAAAVLAPALPSGDPHVLMLQANLLARQGRREEGEALAREATARFEALGRPPAR